jgi:hypothetical protein
VPVRGAGGACEGGAAGAQVRLIGVAAADRGLDSDELGRGVFEPRGGNLAMQQSR